ELASPWYFRLEVADRPGVLAHVAAQMAEEGVSIARLSQTPSNGHAAIDLVTHTAPAGRLDAALDAIGRLDEVESRPEPLRVIA
ncbi:MAG TPA: ACT domain-containing protein, partial [Gaiellaceae bacterium]